MFDIALVEAIFQHCGHYIECHFMYFTMSDMPSSHFESTNKVLKCWGKSSDKIMIKFKLANSESSRDTYF